MEHGIEQMLEKRAAVKQSLQNMNENGEQPSMYDQKPIQISTPSNTAGHSNYEHFDFTSNDDLYCSAAFNAFDSTTTDIPTSDAKVASGITSHSEQSSSGADGKSRQASAPLNVAAAESTTDMSASTSKVVFSGISQSEADFTMFGSGADNADSYRTPSAPEKVKLASANIIASASAVRPDPKNIITEDTTVIASGSKILIPTKKESTVQKTAFATLKFLRPGLKWMVKGPSAESPSEEFDVDLYVDGETFTGCSNVKLLARQYAAEAALVKLFSLEFERGLGMNNE